MANERYLAMTAEEFAETSVLPPKIAWMGCHFSPDGKALAGLPYNLPRGSLLILDDREPLTDGNAVGPVYTRLCRVLQGLECSGLVLDFQQPGQEAQAALASRLIACPPCPVAVSDGYAKGLHCPVFLSPCPHHVPLVKHLDCWQDREIWLDLAADAEQICLTPQGASITPAEPLQAENFFTDPRLHCRYRIETQDHAARFTLWRTRAELSAFQQEAQTLGVHKFIGLYQELGKADRYSPIFHQFR